jgi:hypothetical protein
MSKTQDVAQFMGSDFAKVVKIFKIPATLPATVEDNVPFHDSKKGLIIDDARLVEILKKSGEGQHPGATFRGIHLPKRVAKRNRIDAIGSDATCVGKSVILVTKRSFIFSSPAGHKDSRRALISGYHLFSRGGI